MKQIKLYNKYIGLRDKITKQLHTLLEKYQAICLSKAETIPTVSLDIRVTW